MTKEMKLNYRELSWLGNAFEKHSIISPFKLIQVEGFDEKDQQDLVDIGIIGTENKVLPEYFSELEMLAIPDGYVETVFRRGPINARKMVYSKGEKKISLSYTEEGLVVTSPASAEGMTNFMREYTGGSSLTGGDLDLELPTREMYLFAVLSDLYRRDVFKAYAEEETFYYSGFTIEELLDLANTTRKNSQSLAYHVFAVTGGTGLFEAKEVTTILESLEKQGLISNDAGNYSPIGEALLFAGNFLVIENMLDVVIGQVHEDLLYRSGFTVIQAGPLDLAYLEYSEDKVSLQCLSAQAVLKIIQTVLAIKPDIV
jgi:hypothetical protein